MKPMTITITPPFSWQKRGAIFFSIFAGLWVFLEPLSAFGLTKGYIESVGVWGYVDLLLFSLIPTALIEYFQHRKVRGKISLVKLTILLTENGTEHMVNVPRSMRIEQFLSIFVTRVQINALKMPVDAYELSLNVLRNGNYQKVDSNSTIQEADLIDNDLCKITGDIMPRYASVTMTADYRRSWQDIANNIERRYKIVRLLEKILRKIPGYERIEK